MDSMQGMFGGGAPAAAPVESASGYGAGIDPFGGGVGAGVNPTGTPPSFFPDSGGGGGFDWTKVIPAAIPAATGLIGMFTGQGNATDKAISAMNKSTGPIQKAGNQALGAYTSGTLTGPQQAKVDAFKQANLAKWRQYLANAGIPEGSAMADIEAKVNQDATAYAEQLLQQDFNNAYQATGLASNNLGRVAQMQALQDAEQRKQWQQFMQAMGQLGTQIPDWFS